MNPFERSHCTNLFFLSRSSCQIGIAGGSPAYTTISIRSRPVFGPARKSRSFNQSSPRPAVRTELPTLDSSTKTRALDRADVFKFFFCIASVLLNFGVAPPCSRIPSEFRFGPASFLSSVLCPLSRVLRGLCRSRSRFLCSCGERHNFCQRSPVLLKGRFERQFAVRNLTQRDVGMTEARNKFNQRAVSKRELSDTARHHVYEDLLIGDDFGSGFNE